MKNTIYLITLLSLLLVNCSPKTAEIIAPVLAENTQEWRSSVPSPSAPRAVKMGEYNVFDMANGLKVIVVENHKLPRVSYQLSLNHLALMEGDQAGYVSMAGDLLGTGTKTKSKYDIDKSIDFIGASFNTSSNGMFASTLTKHQDKLLEIVSDVLYNPSFSKDEFDKLVKQGLSGLQADEADPNSIASNIALRANYGLNHPYGEVLTQNSLNAITLDKCKEYYNTYFKPNNAYLTIVGDITLAEAKEKVELYFGEWKKGQVPQHNYEAVAAPNETKVSFGNKDAAVQSVVNITYPVDLKPGSDDELSASVMNAILGGGVFLGRLMQNLREDKAFTYGARSSIRSDVMVGSFRAGASVRNEVTDSSVVELLYEMNRIASEPISTEDLRLAKNSLAGSFARSLESPQTLARYAKNIVKFNLPQDHYTNYLDRLEKVTVDDVLRVSKKYITTNNANIVVVGDKSEIAEKLLQFDTDGVIDYYDAFGNILEISDEEISDDITPKSIVREYLTAIGGQNKIAAVKTLSTTYTMEVMGMNMEISTQQSKPNLFALRVGTADMAFQEQKYDGTKVLSSNTGGSETVTSGPVYDEVVAMSGMFQELDYTTDEYSLTLGGRDKVDGTDVFKISVINSNGKKFIEYYAEGSKLLLRRISTAKGMAGEVTITQDFEDYEMTDGILFPTKLTTSGAMPVPMIMDLKEIKVNQPIDDSVFEIK